MLPWTREPVLLRPRKTTNRRLLLGQKASLPATTRLWPPHARSSKHNGLVDKYAYITNNEVEWGLGKLKKPEGFVFGTSASGFGAAFTYIETDDSQRIFMSANSALRQGPVVRLVGRSALRQTQARTRSPPGGRTDARTRAMPRGSHAQRSPPPQLGALARAARRLEDP